MNLLQKFIVLIVPSLMLSACQQQFVIGPVQPTESALVANSYENGLSTELAIHYEHAYKNLRIAYGRCMAFTSEKNFVYTDNKFEPNLAMATLFARSKGGVYLYKATLESIGDNQTRFTLYLPKDYKFAKMRFKQDIKRVLGNDKQCNLQAHS